jgi:replicative DNA helicase
MKRHEAALGVQEGIANLSLIARSLAEAAEEAVGEGIGAERDAAVRVIVHRLARLCRVDEISYGYDAVTLADTYCTLMNECKARSQEQDAGGRLIPLKERYPDAVQGKLQHKPR